MRSERVTVSVLKKIINIIISLVILAIQLLIYYIYYNSTRDVGWLKVTMRVISIVCVIGMFSNSLSTAYKLIWTIIILIFPFAGTFLYLLFGNQRSFPMRKNKKVHTYLDKHIPINDNLNKLKEEDIIGYKHARIVNYATKMPIYINNKVDFYPKISEKHQQMLEDMKNASKYIFMEFFILANGKMLDSIIEVLKEISIKDIEIKILYDDIGSKLSFFGKTAKRLKEIKNVRLVKYEPLGLSINPAVNFRDHRKLVIIDGKIGYVGGDNLADEYANWKKRFGVWRDNSIRIVGKAVKSLIFLFAETWYMSTKETLDVNKYQAEVSDTISNGYIMPYGDGPTDTNNPAIDLYNSLCANAQKYLYISTPYFVIDQEFISNICSACKSGIDVRILVPGIPDKKIIYRLTKSHYGEILKAGGKIYEYTPGFNHAKNYICDDKYAVVGTINVDYRSLYLHFENGVLLINEKCIKDIKQDFLDAIEKSKEVTLESWKKRNIFTRLIEFILRVFSPMI